MSNWYVVQLTPFPLAGKYLQGDFSSTIELIPQICPDRMGEMGGPS